MIKKLNSSLTAKIFLITALLLAVCCIATYAFIAWMVPKIYPNQADMEKAELYTVEMAEEFRHTDYGDIESIAAGMEENARNYCGSDLELHLFDSSGTEVYGNGAIQSTVQSYDAGKRTSIQYVTFIGSTEVYSFFLMDGAQAVNHALEAVNKAFPYLLATVFAISILAALIYSKYITSPILKISKASQKMIDLDFSAREKSSRADELGTLDNNLSALAQKLSSTLNELESANEHLKQDIDKERQLERQRTEFFSAVSHELKTPITIAKGQLQGMICEVGRYKDRDTYLVKSLDVINGMETMVQELLTISRMDTPGYACHYEPVDLATLIRQCLTAQEDIFIQKDILLTCELPESAIHHGDGQLLKRAFDNLISNALSYSPNGNRIVVSVEQQDNSISVSIENTGVHIEPEELPRLFEAFYRPDQSRSRQTGGSGLGLYIVKRILDLHHAQYVLGNSKDGVMFTIQF